MTIHSGKTRFYVYCGGMAGQDCHCYLSLCLPSTPQYQHPQMICHCPQECRCICHRIGHTGPAHSRCPHHLPPHFCLPHHLQYKLELYLGEVNEPLYSTVSADQRETSTVLSFVNALGCVCPPLVIYKGQRVQTNWSDSIPQFIKLAATSKAPISLEVAYCTINHYH